MERLMFGWDFEVDAWSRFWRWNLINICVWTCDMNSTLGSVVPLAMFNSYLLVNKRHCWGFLRIFFSKCQAESKIRSIMTRCSWFCTNNLILVPIISFWTFLKGSSFCTNLNVPSSKGVPEGPNITADLEEKEIKVSWIYTTQFSGKRILHTENA